jgi:hypothetical protein
LGNTQYSNGQDLVNGAVWDIQYVTGKGFSLKNVGTGKYLKTNDTAKYDEPTYFTFATLGYQPTGIQNVEHRMSDTKRFNNDWYTLDGRRVNPDNLQPGLYIHQGRKIVIK